MGALQGKGGGGVLWFTEGGREEGEGGRVGDWVI